MIRENNLNFTEIAAALQYSTVHHFSRQFKEKFGITPTEYAPVPYDKRRRLPLRRKTQKRHAKEPALLPDSGGGAGFPFAQSSEGGLRGGRVFRLLRGLQPGFRFLLLPFALLSGKAQQ